MPQHREVSELEQRLSREVMLRAEKAKKVVGISERYPRFTEEYEEISRKRQKKREESQQKAGRILFVPVFTFVVAYLVLMVVIGVFTGETVIFSKYGKTTTILLENEPVLFWIAIAFHLAMSALFGGAAFQLGCATKWFSRRTPAAQSNQNSSEVHH